MDYRNVLVHVNRSPRSRVRTRLAARVAIEHGGHLIGLSATIVMGAYGHSRFRETLLGGATRDILEAMTVPVLMSH